MMGFLILALAPVATRACAGGYRGVPPEGHPSVAGQPDRNHSFFGDEDPNTLYPCVGTSACKKALRSYRGVFGPDEGPWLPTDGYSLRLLDSVAGLSATMGKDLCYWSQQTLPAPNNGSGFHHINEYDAERVMNIYGELATARMQKLMQTQSVDAIQFVGCSYGYELRQAQCKFNQNTSVSCTPAVNKQKIKWPISSVMLKINPATIEPIANLIFTWRTTQSGHWPNMHAGGLEDSGAFGWGYRGSLFGKVVPCDDIPKDIIKQSHACDEVNPESGKVYSDDWFEVWSNLCNIYEDPLIDSTMESCART
jgi:hypothetical protein